MSASTGVFLPGYIADDATESDWAFDAAFPFRATVERSIRNGLAVGANFTWARVPLTYSTSQSVTGCGTFCSADATVVNYGALLRMTGGQTFHQVLQLTVGATRYGNFQSLAGTALPPHANTDFTFGAGYGIAYALSRDWQVQLLQDAQFVVHERSTVGGRLRRNALTSIGLRVGL